jgi:hypothetical protein
VYCRTRGNVAGEWSGENIDEPELKLARYRPSHYLEGGDDSSELSVVGLLQTGLPNQFNSSSYAFAYTLDRMVAQSEIALGLLEEGYPPTRTPSTSG